MGRVDGAPLLCDPIPRKKIGPVSHLADTGLGRAVMGNLFCSFN